MLVESLESFKKLLGSSSRGFEQRSGKEGFRRLQRDGQAQNCIDSEFKGSKPRLMGLQRKPRGSL